MWLHSVAVVSAAAAAPQSAVPTLAGWPTKWAAVQVCGAPVPATPEPCEGGPYSDPGVCDHMRCCWIVGAAGANGSCVRPWAAPSELNRSALRGVAFYGGDQAVVQLTSLQGGLSTPGDDALAVTDVAFTPIFGSAAPFPANLSVGGRVPVLRAQRWRPHEILRRSTVRIASGETLEMESSVRIGFDAPVVLLRLTLRNPAEAAAARRPELPLRTSASMHLPLELQWTEDLSGWEWGHDGPTAGDDADYTVTLGGGGHGHAAVRSCDARKLAPGLLLRDCDASDSWQHWTGQSLLHADSGLASMLRNDGTATCISNVIVHGNLPIGNCSAERAGLFQYLNGTLRRAPVRKRRAFSSFAMPFNNKVIVLPRQARDRHRGNSKKRAAFSQAAGSPPGTPPLCLDAIHGFKNTVRKR